MTGVVLRQRAQSPRWLRGLIALVLAGFAQLFVPFAWEHPVAWFVGLAIFSYTMASWTLGVRSWIEIDNAGGQVFVVRDNSSRSNAYLPAAYIRSMERCDCRSFGNDVPPVYAHRSHHHRFAMLGYEGPGLIVDYQLPKHLCADGHERSWQIPAPRAAEFLEELRIHVASNRSESEL